jgi:hypothetical protein
MADHSNMKLGKLPAKHDPRAQSMRAMLHEFGLAVPPYWRVNWERKLPASLGVMLNDHLGDCTCAALGHYVQTVTAWTKPAMVTPSDSAVLAAYEASGYVPGNPATDKGWFVTAAMDYLRINGLEGHHIAGWVNCQPGNLSDLKNAIWLCGNVNLGVELPLTAQAQDVWDLVSTTGDGAPGSWGGHDVLGIEWDDHRQEISVITWGGTKWMTYAFWQYYCSEQYGMVGSDWVMNSGLTPSDIPVAELLNYVASGF